MNLNINGAEIKGQNSVTLLVVVEIENELNFNNNISNICKNAGNKKKTFFLEFRVFLVKKEVSFSKYICLLKF